MKLCYAGPFTDPSGYGEATRNIIYSLHVAGVELTTQKISFTNGEFDSGPAGKIADQLEHAFSDYKVKILHVTPDIYKHYTEMSKHHIGHLFWETDRLPAGWTEACNKMQEIWTGTEGQKKMLIESGVKVPIFVFPQPTITDLPKFQPFEFGFNGFVFYSIFDWIERKNPKALLHAFWKEFKGHTDVCLLLKVHRNNYNQDAINMMLQDLKGWKNSLGFKNCPKVFVSTKLFSYEDKHRFHETGDVFVSAHRGEGWGIPQIEAMLHGKPVISTGKGGIHEYMKYGQGVKVKYEDVIIPKTFGKYYEPGMFWAEIDKEDLQATLRKFYNYGTTSKKSILTLLGGKGKNFAKNLCNPMEVGKLMRERLEVIQKNL